MMKPTILYIDDELNNLESFELCFWDKYHVLTTNCTDKAECLLAQNTVHLVISDFEMPQETGCQFINRMKPLYSQLKFLILSGRTPEEVYKCKNIDDWVTKPFIADELQIIIDKFLTIPSIQSIYYEK